jgi:hypothetical protein
MRLFVNILVVYTHSSKQGATEKLSVSAHVPTVVEHTGSNGPHSQTFI